MSSKGKRKRPIIDSAKSIFLRKVEFYTTITFEECYYRLRNKRNWTTTRNILFSKPKIEMEYIDRKSENVIEFEVNSILNKDGSRITLSGEAHRLHDGGLLITGKTSVNWVYLITLATVFFAHFLFMEFCGVVNLAGAGFCFVPLIYLLVAGIFLHRYSATQNVLINLIYDVLSSEQKLPLSTGA